MTDTPFWIAALGLFVGALGVLFAVGAIAAGFILFRQSKEHRERVDKVIREYQSLLSETRAQIQTQLDSTIADLRLQADALAGDHKVRLEHTIAKLEEQDRVNRAVGGALRFGDTFEAKVTSALPSPTCPKCGHSWRQSQGLLSLFNLELTCPNCDHSGPAKEFLGRS